MNKAGKTAYIFPGQGTQFAGMAARLLSQRERWETKMAEEMLEKSDRILGFNITDLMLVGEEEDLCQTAICQPAVYLYSVILYRILEKRDNPKPDMVAGHSLGEISALTVANVLTFEDGLKLVLARSKAMKMSCEKGPFSAMAAVVGMEEKAIEEVVSSNAEVVVANYNSPHQTVISGTAKGISAVSQELKKAGAKIVIPLKVEGAFHSPFMSSAQEELREAVRQVKFRSPICPVYQNLDGKPSTDRVSIRKKLVAQMTSPVLWRQTISNMEADGAVRFVEVGPNNVLQNLVRRIVFAEVETYSINSY